MSQSQIIYLLLSVLFSEYALANIKTCSDNVVPEKPIQLIWPGLPAGGIPENADVESISLRFIVSPSGKTSKVNVLRSSSTIYEHAARKTLLKTTFKNSGALCLKDIDLRYE